MPTDVAMSPRLITRGKPPYPAALSLLGDPPRRLFVAGRIPDGRAIAIVGTRRASPEGLAFAEGLAFDLASRGIVVVSGGAHGIDSAAHRGALRAQAPTVAVLGSSLDAPYPPGNARLFSEIAETGAVLTELGPKDVVRRTSFLARNRIVAALGSATIVIQAPDRSGALSTAALAKKLGKPVFAVPWAPSDPRGRGCLDLLRRGALICTCVEDVLSVPALGGTVRHQRRRGRDKNMSLFNDMDDDERLVWGALRGAACHVDALCDSLSLPVERVQRALLSLTLKACVEDLPGGVYARQVR